MIASLRKADFILFIFFLAVAALIAAAPLMHPSGSGQQVKIVSQGDVIGIYPLDKDTEIEVSRYGHYNLISIQNHTVHMEHSNCRNQVCVNTGEISRTGETIVCLPNYVIVEIISSEEGGGEDVIDAVSK